jgi:hypothetical protein
LSGIGGFQWSASEMGECTGTRCGVSGLDIYTTDRFFQAFNAESAANQAALGKKFSGSRFLPIN